MTKKVIEQKTVDLFSSHCFWDQDYEKLDLEKSKNYIIARVLNCGSMNDITNLFDYYGWETVKKEVLKIRYLNDKIFNWLSSLFEISPKKFRCYNNKGVF
jgi:hypothetical protein